MRDDFPRNVERGWLRFPNVAEPTAEFAANIKKQRANRARQSVTKRNSNQRWLVHLHHRVLRHPYLLAIAAQNNRAWRHQAAVVLIET